MPSKQLKPVLDIALNPQPGDECSLMGGHVRLVVNGVSDSTILFEIRRPRSSSTHSCKRTRLMESLRGMGMIS